MKNAAAAAFCLQQVASSRGHIMRYNIAGFVSGSTGEKWMKRKCECIMITAVLLFLIALLMYPVQGAGQAMPLGQTSSGTDTHKPGQTTFGTAGGTAGNTGAGNGKDYQILDHSMASKIDESTYQVIARSSAFRP